MTGYRGYVIQAVSTVGPIRRVDVGAGGRIGGGLAQRWTDPTASSDYTVISPGPFVDARNDLAAPATPLNFDSHFLVPNSAATYAVLAETAAPFSGFITATSDPARPNFNPIPSTPTVGYGTALWGPNGPFEQGRLRGDLTLLPDFRDDVVDVAYLVANRGFDVRGGIYTSENTFEWSSLLAVTVVLPEPAYLVLLLAWSCRLTSRRRRLR